nr:hypothetical protein Iba_chr01aCG17360 [Ipomoea batatas]
MADGGDSQVVDLERAGPYSGMARRVLDQRAKEQRPILVVELRGGLGRLLGWQDEFSGPQSELAIFTSRSIARMQSSGQFSSNQLKIDVEDNDR